VLLGPLVLSLTASSVIGGDIRDRWVVCPGRSRVPALLPIAVVPGLL
jgi:hypothetical protein